jgi:hypothetical protein
MNEIDKAGVTMGQPSKSMSGVDLTEVKYNENTSAYSRYQDLISEVQIGGMTLRERINSVINTKRYRNLPDDRSVNSEVKSGRAILIEQQIDRYRDAAKRQLLREMPKLKEAMNDKAQLRRDVRLGRTQVKTAMQVFADKMKPLM